MEQLRSSLYEPLPEWMWGRVVHNVVIPLEPGDIRSGPQCPECQTPTQRVKIRYLDGGKVVVKAEAPGYRCPKDGIEIQNSQALLLFLPLARDILRDAGDHEIARATDATYRHEQRYAERDRFLRLRVAIRKFKSLF